MTATLPTDMVLTDEEYEALTLAHWMRRNPGADEVTVTVRRAESVVGFARYTPDGAVTLNPAVVFAVLPAV